MNTIETPYRINLLLHFHCSPEPYPLRSAPAFQEEVDSLLKEGAIKPRVEITGGLHSGEYRTTPLGEAWVQALCNVPPPQMVFVDQLGNILE